MWVLQGHHQSLQWVKHSWGELGQGAGTVWPSPGHWNYSLVQGTPSEGCPGQDDDFVAQGSCLSCGTDRPIKHKGFEKISLFRWQKVNDKKLKQVHRHQRKNMFCSMNEQPKIEQTHKDPRRIILGEWMWHMDNPVLSANDIASCSQNQIKAWQCQNRAT